MFKEFKEFAFKGNLVDMAVGFILGGGFTLVVKSLVNNVVMPPLGMLLAGVDFSKMEKVLKPAQGETEAVVLKYGQFIQDLISFTILAFVVFLVVKKLMGALKKEEEKPKEEAKIPNNEVLLAEIRDLLKKQE
jgi:large conductance mechanosensitive channel